MTRRDGDGDADVVFGSLAVGMLVVFQIFAARHAQPVLRMMPPNLQVDKTVQLGPAATQ